VVVTVRGVVFDIGGVLEIVEPYETLLGVWARRVGRSPAELQGTVAERLGGRSLATGEVSQAEHRKAWQDAFDLSDEQADGVMRDLWAWYCGQPDSAMVDFAASLRPRFATAILSNSADGAREEEQARYGFEQLVDVIVYPHEVGLAKPDPRIFALTCDRLGLLPGELVLVDDVAANVEGARALGLHAVLHADAVTSIAAVGRLLG